MKKKIANRKEGKLKEYRNKKAIECQSAIVTKDKIKKNSRYR